MSPLAAAAHRLDERLRAHPAAASVWPVRWSQMLGHLILVSFAVLTVTGVGLAFAYEPGIEPVVYRGNAALYDGKELPRAFASVVRISEDVPGGLLARRVHAAAAHLLVGATVLHLARVLYTGAFQGRRAWNHVLGMVLAGTAMIAGWTGANLPFGLLAGTSLRVGHSVLGSVPYLGEPLSLAVYGGAFPTGAILERSYWLHVLLLPLVFVGGSTAHVWLTRRHTPASHPHDADVDHIRGLRLWPEFAGKLLVLLLGTSALLAAAAALVPWSDLQLEGPYQVAQAGNTLQPPWYLFIPEGAMRLLPAVDVPLPGRERVGNVFVAAVLLPTVLLGLVAVYPWIDRRLGGARAERHVLEHPLAVPGRAAIVTFLLTLLAVVSAGAAVDVVASALQVSVQNVIRALRVGVAVVPVAASGTILVLARRREAP